MKPGSLLFCTVSLALPAFGIAMSRGQSTVTLPVYDRPVHFFSEGVQGIKLGKLPAGIASFSAAACIKCHQEEHADWHASAHARSTTEPVFVAAFEAEPRVLCRSCHSPLLDQHPKRIETGSATRLVTTRAGSPGSGQTVARRKQRHVTRRIVDNPAYNAALAKEGVTCVTCHVRDGTILTANGTAPAPVPHPLSFSPVMSKSEFCGGCHQFDIANPGAHPFERLPAGQRRVATLPEHVRPILRHAILQGSPPSPPSTEPEDPETPPVPPQPGLEHQYQNESREQKTMSEFFASPAAARGATCQSCHMPRAADGRRHTWPGRDSERMLRQAVHLAARLDRRVYRPGETLQAVITLKNDAGHRFPTGDTIHAGILDVWLRDGDRTLGRQVFVIAKQSSSAPIVFEGSGQLLFRHHRFVPHARHGDRLEGPERADTRLLPGEEAMLLYQRPITKELTDLRAPTLRIRVFHNAVHPGLKGSRIDPGIDTRRLIRELVLPVRIEPATPATEVQIARLPAGPK